MHPYLKPAALAALVILPAMTDAASLEIRAVNPLPLARPSQTLEISARDLAPLHASNLDLIHVTDPRGNELLCQAIDTDGDALHAFDAVIFQANFAPGETQLFSMTVGRKQTYQKDQFKAFGRFVRERFDDFAWENDCIAHRAYGQALETWKGEPLTSSTIDIWSKRTPRMVINDWYMTGDYHVDHGEGGDFFSAGLSRGCGGSGLWANNRLWLSRNFINSKVLANGPLRVLFELEYAPFDVNGVMVGETKRIALDAGQQFSRFESHYHPGQAAAPALTAAAGLKKVKGEKVEFDAAQGWLAKWQAMEKQTGSQGVAVITGPAVFEKPLEDSLNHLVLIHPDAAQVATYWAGFCWDRAGRCVDANAWNRHVSEFARGLGSPIEIKRTLKP